MRRHPPELIWHTWPTVFGTMGAAATAVGVCRVLLPQKSAGDLQASLVGECQAAIRDAARFKKLVGLTLRYFDGRSVDFAAVRCVLPPPGIFQGQVLRACRKIPYGRTLSYGQLAARIRRPRAVRAVAGALARNPVPLVIPCHRVIRTDGGLGGFSAAGGTDLKRRMLELEGAATAGPAS